MLSKCFVFTGNVRCVRGMKLNIEQNNTPHTQCILVHSIILIIRLIDIDNLPSKQEVFYFLFSLERITLFFLSPAHEVGAGDFVITMSGRAAVWPCVRVLFPDDISETVSRIAFILHTDIP